MAKRGQTSRQASGGETSTQTKSRSSRRQPTLAGHSCMMAHRCRKTKKVHRKKMTPIELIFLKEVGREMEPEEREILLGIHRTRRKSTGRAPALAIQPEQMIG